MTSVQRVMTAAAFSGAMAASFGMAAGCGGETGEGAMANSPGHSRTGAAHPASSRRIDPEGAAPAARRWVTEDGAEDSSAAETSTSERPGLGTEWGETRDSPITEVRFVRAEPRLPFAVARVFYNDHEGVEARAGEPKGAYAVPGVPGAITFSLRGADGEPLDAARAGGDVYVVGHEGERYSIVVENHTPSRFEAVATVDGLDVISGRPGDFENRGYVLSPWSTLEIDGFRQNRDQVAAFRFARVRDSYAAARGDDRNVGVIGLAFFAERGDEWSDEELRRRDRAMPFPDEGRFAPPPR